ncbi:MAG TPA: MerR family transcriptional regulator [Jiangellaceae bacterium]|nr:MerR family transcriptional regulator [Jiangellaceae bacterium]
MRIGELARRTGASPRSLRYYEQQGFIAPGRSDNGYRTYSVDTVRVVHNVRSLLASGLTLTEIRQVGECLYTEDLSQTEACDHVIALFEARIHAVDAQLAAVTDTRDRLTAELESLRADRVS